MKAFVLKWTIRMCIVARWLTPLLFIAATYWPKHDRQTEQLAAIGMWTVLGWCASACRAVRELVATLRARKITGRRFYRSPNERAAAFRMICMKLCRKGMFYNLRVSSLPGDEATHG